MAREEDPPRVGVEFAMGQLRDNAGGLISRRVADGGDRPKLETEIDGALERVSAECADAPGKFLPALQ